MLLLVFFYFPLYIILDNAVKNRWRLIERFAGKDRSSRSLMKLRQEIIDTADDNELVDHSVVGYSHVEHEHCHYYVWDNNYLPCPKMVAPMVLQQHEHNCDHEAGHAASEHDVSVDNCEENTVSTPAQISSGINIDKAEVKEGCFEDNWVDDINQIAQLHIRDEEKTMMMVVTPSPRTPTSPMIPVEHLLSQSNADNYCSTLGSNKPTPRCRKVSLQC
jgi:hypothetical protein